jgi:hypothetical protein
MARWPRQPLSSITMGVIGATIHLYCLPFRGLKCSPARMTEHYIISWILSSSPYHAHSHVKRHRLLTAS